jgi:predicted site-specific integrase-resolvase
MSPLPVTYTSDEVAAALKISLWTLRRLVKAGAANPMRLSNSPTAEMRFDDQDVADIKKALRSNTGGAIPAPPATRRRRRRVAS